MGHRTVSAQRVGHYVYDMLSPVADRPELALLEAQNSTPHLGSHRTPKCSTGPGGGAGRYIDGYFVLDTKLPGNLNTGHEFSDKWKEGQPTSEPPMGVIGPSLSERQRLSLIEFLKTQ